MICFLWILAACMPKPLEIGVKQDHSKLVVASQIIPEKELVIALTSSFSPLKNPLSNNSQPSDNSMEELLVEGAVVTVHYLERIDTLKMIRPGVYASDLKLAFDYGTYTLFVHEPVTDQHISAASEMLPKVMFDAVTPVIEKDGDSTKVKVHYTFTDPPGERNYYVISYYSKSKVDANANNLDINSYFNRGSNQLQEMQLLTDQLFTADQYSDSLELPINPNDTIAVVLSNISEGYYKFLHAYQKSGNILNQISGEPLNYPTNITNGFGYFNTHNPDVAVFDLNKY